MIRARHATLAAVTGILWAPSTFADGPPLRRAEEREAPACGGGGHAQAELTDILPEVMQVAAISVRFYVFKSPWPHQC
jgi:hypothetical protein